MRGPHTHAGQPTSMRAIRARYNPFLQARHRVEQLKQLGHSVDKVEYIVMGGTFMCLDAEYRDYFIRNLHDALSGHTSSSVDEAVKCALCSGGGRLTCAGTRRRARPSASASPSRRGRTTASSPISGVARAPLRRC